jgi:anti-sigma-K factor RskA
MDHGTYQQLAAGAVLGDLDRSERIAFEAHRATCRSCRSLVDELGSLAFDLSLAAPARRPPASLRAAVLAATSSAGSATGVTTGGSGVTAPEIDSTAGPTTLIRLRRDVRRLRLLNVASLAAAAALAVVAVGSLVRTASLADDLAASEAAARAAEEQLAAQAETMTGAMTVAIDPTHQTATLAAEPLAADATAIVIYSPGTTAAYLMASGLPPTPDGKVYQLWIADSSGVHALGTFTYDGVGAFVAPFEQDLQAAAATMVTLEPVGGAAGAPGPQVVFGEL